mgnify:CR=1 FL=1
MGFFNWLFYIICGIILYFFIDYLNTKYKLDKIDKIVISNILMVFISGLCFRLGIIFTSNIFLIFVFMMITDIVFNSYFNDNDFFDKNEKNISYYIILVIIGFVINQEFINHVSDAFLTGRDFRIVFWLLVIIYIFNFSKTNKLYFKNNKEKNDNISINSILTNYAKLKYLYYDECDCEDRNISNILYAIMIYENKRRNKIQRKFDNFSFKINGGEKKLGIMQVNTKKFISDSESINIVYKKIIKKHNKNKNVNYYDLIDDYYGYDNKSVKYIFDIIKKF